MGARAKYNSRIQGFQLVVLLITFCLSLDVVRAAGAARGPQKFSKADADHQPDQALSYYAVGLKLMHREHVHAFSSLGSADFAGPREVMLNAIARSTSRVRYLNSRVVAKLGLNSPAPAAPGFGSRDEDAHSRHALGQQNSLAGTSVSGAVGGALSTPAGGGGQEYFVSLKIGNPAQEVLLAVDTGSEISWVQCTPCVFCYKQILPLFDPYSSSSYNVFNCSNENCQSSDGVSNVCSEGDGSCAYEATYGDGSDTWGSLSSETFTLQTSATAAGRSTSAADIIFGCGRVNEGLFVGSSGLLGMDRGTFSFATQMSGIFGPGSQKFSYCMIDRIQHPNATSFLYLGSSSNNRGSSATTTVASGDLAATAKASRGHDLASDLAYTSMLNAAGVAPSLYYVGFLGITVGKQQLAIDPSVMELSPNGTGGTIVDSGTYISYLPEQVYIPLQNAILEQANLQIAPPSSLTPGLQTCFLLKKSSKAAAGHTGKSSKSKVVDMSDLLLPPVVFQLEGGVDIELGFHNLVLGPFDPEGELYCLAFVNTGPVVPSLGVAVILGNVQQQNFLIEFDLTNSRVGFKKTDCATAVYA